MSALTGKWDEAIYTNRADFTAVASTASEASLLASATDPTQPYIPAVFFNDGTYGKCFRVTARGVFSTTGTPTLIFKARLGTTQGSTYLSGTAIGTTGTITTASTITNAKWKLEFLMHCYTPGYGTNNCTLSGAGEVESMIGFATPFRYDIEPTTPPTGTWTATIDAALTQWLNLTVTWSASSASNTITLKNLVVEGMN